MLIRKVTPGYLLLPQFEMFGYKLISHLYLTVKKFQTFSYVSLEGLEETVKK